MKNTICKLSVGVVVALFLCAASSVLYSAEMLVPGIHSKLGGGGGQTISRGSSALWYNPANAIYSKKIEPYVDLSFAMIKYAYYCSAVDPSSDDESTFAPAMVTVNTPVATLGLSYRPVPSFSIGFSMLPTGAGGATTVEAVPMNITGSGYSALDIEMTSSGYKFALGAAYRLSHALTIGAGLIRTSETNQISAFDPAQSLEEPFLDLSYTGAFNQFILGFRSELMKRKLVLGGSYKTAVLKTYAGEIFINDTGDKTEYSTYEGTAYDAAVLGLGGEMRFSGFGLFLDYTREMWAAGRTLVVRGYTENDPKEKDYIDVNNIAIGGKYWPAKGHSLIAGFGNYQANIADGLIEEGASVDGVSFGDFGAVPKMVFSGGYRYKLVKRGYFFGGVHYAKGSRTVPEGAPSEGYYSLSIIMVSGGLAYGF